MKLNMVKLLNGDFRPAYSDDLDKAKKVKAGKTISCDIRTPRNLAFHKKCFALFNMVFENQDHFINFEHFRKWLTMKAGHYDTIHTPTGVMYEAKSLSFAKMKQDEFDKLYSDLLNAIVSIYQWDKQVIIDNVNDFE